MTVLTSIRSTGYISDPALDPEASVFVSASAGTGKTRLLTSRVLRLLLHGVRPSRILCLTFTKAAAAEMQSRIQGELGQWVMAEEGKLRESLAKLLGGAPDKDTLARARSLFAEVLEAPDGVRIETIHGFCQALLKRFPVEAGISPHFAVIDARTEQELLQEARARLLTRAAERDAELRRALAALACSAGESTLKELLDEVIRQKRKLKKWLAPPGGVEHAIRTMRQRLDVALGATEESIFAERFAYEEATLAILRRVADILSQGEKTDQKTGQGLAVWLSSPRKGKEITAYLSIFLTAKNEPRQQKQLFTKKALADPALIQALLAEQERVCRFADACRALAIAERTGHLLHVAEALLALYESEKRARSAMDFDDLILAALELLQQPGISPWVLYKLDGGIDHVLIDEAQDTAPEQWAIVKALTEEFFSGQSRTETVRPIFVVGDEKQSIFGFQGADPSGLGRMKRYFTERIRAAALTVHHQELTRSYRSAPEILQAVDAVFAQPQARAGLTFDDAEFSHVPTLTHSGLVEIWPLMKAEEKSAASPATRLARAIAAAIRGWLDSGMVLEAKGRAVEPGDIMILVRNRGRLVDRLIRQLKRSGVPVAGQDRMRLNENLAVQDLIALGQVLLLPEDDLTLAALLKSPLFNLDEETLFRLCWDRGDKSVWERLKSCGSRSDSTGFIASTDPAPPYGSQDLRDAYNLLADLRARADYLAPFELYSYLLDTLGARRRILGRMGEEYADPMDEFLSQALLYEKSHPPSLQGFLHWLTASDTEIKRDMEQQAAGVRILTVHGAKGLQAPIVILPDTAEPPAPKDKLFWQEEEMLCLWPGRQENDDAFTRRLREARKRASEAEERRLLYVALTRAEERLYICGATGRSDARAQSWHTLVRNGLSGMAGIFEMPWGEGMRIGNPPLPSGEVWGEGITSGFSLTRRFAPLSPDGRGNFAFLFQPPPAEPVPPRPLAPSRLGEEPANASPLMEAKLYQRGLLIHTLLQYLPEVTKDKRQSLAMHLASGYAPAREVADACIRETLAVMDDPQFAFIFAPGSLAEAPVAGCVEWRGKTFPVSGQIDRLHIGEKEIWVVDYKSSRLPPAIPPIAYLRQMQLYRLLLQRVYPGKTVRCALLWTAAARLSVLDDALLDEALIGS